MVSVVVSWELDGCIFEIFLDVVVHGSVKCALILERCHSRDFQTNLFNCLVLFQCLKKMFCMFMANILNDKVLNNKGEGDWAEKVGV